MKRRLMQEKDVRDVQLMENKTKKTEEKQSE